MLQYNSFIGNKAAREGGAIMYLCEPSEKELSIDSTPCSLQMNKEIDFIGNSAYVGGAIRWNLVEMDLDDENAELSEPD